MQKAIIRVKKSNSEDEFSQNIDYKTECRKLQQTVKSQEQKIIEQGLEIKELQVLAAGYYCDAHGGFQAYKDYKIAEDELEEYKHRYNLII